MSPEVGDTAATTDTKATITLTELNDVARRLLDLASMHDLEHAHTDKYEHVEEQTLIYLRIYTLGFLHQLPVEWRPILNQLECEHDDPNFDLFLALRQQYEPTSKLTPLTEWQRGYKVPQPSLAQIHNELPIARFPWVNHSVFRSYRKPTRAEQISELLHAQHDTPTPPPMPTTPPSALRSHHRINTLNDLRFRANYMNDRKEDDDVVDLNVYST